MDVDMTVIGAGPVGLYAAHYAGFRGQRTAITAGRDDAGHCSLGPTVRGMDYWTDGLPYNRSYPTTPLTAMW